MIRYYLACLNMKAIECPIPVGRVLSKSNIVTTTSADNLHMVIHNQSHLGVITSNESIEQQVCNQPQFND